MKNWFHNMVSQHKAYSSMVSWSYHVYSILSLTRLDDKYDIYGSLTYFYGKQSHSVAQLEFSAGKNLMLPKLNTIAGKLAGLRSPQIQFFAGLFFVKYGRQFTAKLVYL